MVEKLFLHVQEQLVSERSFMNNELIYMVILQKIDRTAPSVAASLIEQLPDKDDPQRPMEENIARNVVAMAYIGLWSSKWAVNHGSPINYFVSLPSAGADTVGDRNKNIMSNVINCIIRQRHWQPCSVELVEHYECNQLKKFLISWGIFNFIRGKLSAERGNSS